MIDKRTLEKYEKDAKEAGRDSWYLSWALDTNAEERAKVWIFLLSATRAILRSFVFYIVLDLTFFFSPLTADALHDMTTNRARLSSAVAPTSRPISVATPFWMPLDTRPMSPA